MLIIRCIDVETTGLAPPDAAVCEIGWTDVCSLPPDGRDLPRWEVSAPRSILVDPGHPIPPAMSAVHHIVDGDVVGAPKFEDAITPLIEDGVILCAHNAKFERQFITAPAAWICSYKVALHLAPNAPEHKLQTLRYWLKLQMDRTIAEPPHRAGPDSFVCAHLITRMLAKITPQEMIDVSGRLSLLPKMRFGKHAGKSFADIPADYLDWLIGPSGVKDDEDLLFTARHHLKLRSAA